MGMGFVMVAPNGVDFGEGKEEEEGEGGALTDVGGYTVRFCFMVSHPPDDGGVLVGFAATNLDPEGDLGLTSACRLGEEKLAVRRGDFTVVVVSS